MAQTLLDIKPYVPEFDAKADARGGWLESHLKNKSPDVVPTADDRFHKES